MKVSLPGTLVHLGRATELDTTEYELNWSKSQNMGLYCNVKGNRLFIFHHPSAIISQKSDSKDIREGIKLYKRFNSGDYHTLLSANVSTKDLVNRGRVISITYESDKWTGKKRTFIHEFKKQPIYYANGVTRVTLIEISGGKISVNKRGIIG